MNSEFLDENEALRRENALLRETNARLKKLYDEVALELALLKKKLFGKKVADVRTANYDGKKKRERRADFGRTKNWKKAFVRLADGETIEFV